MECLFCRIRDGQIPGIKVYEDEGTLAIMDINPLNDGHTLVMIKAHVEDLYGLTAAQCAAALQAVQRVARAIQGALTPDGLNLLQANGPGAFQSVRHFHMHVVPRWTNDGKGLQWPLQPGDRQRIQDIATRIRAQIAEV